MANASTPDALERLVKDGQLIAYFGFGSLVNPNTHRTKTVGFAKAKVRSWRRRWQARPDIHPEPIALLTANRVDQDVWLPGLLVFDKIDNLPSLDEREAGYDRRVLQREQLRVDATVPQECPIYIYEGRSPAEPDRQHFILQSYLDAVLQGYHAMHGAEAVKDFVADTLGFDTPILRDRSAPRYPRHVALERDEFLLIDSATRHLNFVDAME